MTDPITPEEARAALADAETKSAGVAGRVKSPLWYDCSLAAIIAGLVLTQAAPLPFNIITLALLLAGFGLIVHVYRKRYGVWVSGYRPGKTRLVAISLAVFCVSVMLGVAASAQIFDIYWPAPVGAAAVFVAVLAGSRLWIAAYRADTGTK